MHLVALQSAGGVDVRPGPSGIRRRGEAGFTLMELTIGAALMALILASAYACLSAAVSAREVLEPRLEALQTARVVLARMGADLRAACPLSKEDEFVGIDRVLGGVEADNVDFGTLNHTPRRAGEGDFCQTSYFIDQDRETGELVLWCRRNPRIGVDPFSGGTREELARGVRHFRLEYYDGFDWYDSWGDADGGGRQETSMRLVSNLSGMPEAVRITLGLQPGWRPGLTEGGDVSGDGRRRGLRSGRSAEGPLTYQTVVRLNPSSGLGATASQPGGAPGGGGTGATPDGPPAGGGGGTGMR